MLTWCNVIKIISLGNELLLKFLRISSSLKLTYFEIVFMSLLVFPSFILPAVYEVHQAAPVERACVLGRPLSFGLFVVWFATAANETYFWHFISFALSPRPNNLRPTQPISLPSQHLAHFRRLGSSFCVLGFIRFYVHSLYLSSDVVFFFASIKCPILVEGFLSP